MTRIILLRHGQTPLNAERRLSGHFDAPLSPIGEKQAEFACKYLIENEKIDIIISSDLQRAVNTVNTAAEFFGLPIIRSKELREINTGDWEGVAEVELDKKHKELREKINAVGSDIPFPNGESNKELDERIRKTVKRAIDENDGKTVLFSLHQGAVRSILRLAKELGADIDPIPRVYNASIHVLSYDGGKLIPEDLEIVAYPKEYFILPENLSKK